jgi:enterochelin esterase-like enzyme
MTAVQPAFTAAVADAITAGGPAAVRKLAQHHRGPIVEPASVPNRYQVTFVFYDRGRALRCAGLVCPALPEGIVEMTPIGEATFVATVPFPAGTRVKYHYCPEMPPADEDRDPFSLVYSISNRRIDYFNPRYDQIQIPSLRARICDSILSLPGALPGPARERRPALRHGSASTVEVASEALGHPKQVVIYRPAAPADGAYPLVLLLESADEWGEAASLFDQLLDDGRVRPFVGACVGGGRFTARMRDLGRRDGALSRFLRRELLPLLAQRADVDATAVTVAGFSAGALGALSVVLDEPDAFTGAILISGAFHLTERMEVWRPDVQGEDITARFEKVDAVPARVYVATGQYEDRWQSSTYATATRLANALATAGATVRLDTGPTGHDTVSARAYLASGLAWMLPLYVKDSGVSGPSGSSV